MALSFRHSFIAGAIVVVATSTGFARSTQNGELWREVEIIRTEHGVPHIRATTLRAGAYGLCSRIHPSPGRIGLSNAISTTPRLKFCVRGEDLGRPPSR